MIAKAKTLACRAWASDDLAIRYHDEEWGVPVLMTARSSNSSFWKERSICKTTTPITSQTSNHDASQHQGIASHPQSHPQ